MRRNIPSTQALACFEVAARHESYTRAAQELFLTLKRGVAPDPGARRVLGVQLFRRTRHGVVLTPAGPHAMAARRAGCRGWSATRWT